MARPSMKLELLSPAALPLLIPVKMQHGSACALMQMAAVVADRRGDMRHNLLWHTLTQIHMNIKYK
jgi:hypothetical protein